MPVWLVNKDYQPADNEVNGNAEANAADRIAFDLFDHFLRYGALAFFKSLPVSLKVVAVEPAASASLSTTS